MTAISCTSSSFCVAVDSSGYADIYNGSSWSPSDIDGTQTLRNISCASAYFCVAGTGFGTESVLVYTAPQPPVATTAAATSPTTTGATLNGTVNPEGSATTYQFEYGTTTSYGTSTTSTSAGSGSSGVAESAGVGSLAANTVYHYRVEATNSAGTVYGSDQTFTTLPGNTSLPAISGSNVEGATLTTTNGVWSGSVSLTYTYHWQLCNPSCANISGAEASTYTLIAADAGHTVDVVVTATNSSGSTSATSSQTATILALTAPGAPSTPTLSTNSPAYNVSLSSSTATGSTGGNPEPTYLYQWQRCTTTTTSSCANITGATSQSYTPVSADVGDYLRVGAAATNSVGTSVYTYSAESTNYVTGTAPGTPSTPTLSTNTPTYNTALESSAGTGASAGVPSATAYAYQWQRCTTTTTTSCASISGATSRSYTPVMADSSDFLRVGVVATNSQGAYTGTSATAYSAETTSLVTSPPANTVLPVVSGTVAVGQVLTTTTGTWTGYPAPSYTYQWQSCNSSGLSCSNISGATHTTYILQGSDYGNTVDAVVTATNSVGPVSAASAVTAVVTGLAPSASPLLNVFAGTGVFAAGADGSPATSTTLDGTSGTATDAAGNVLFAETTNYKVRMVAASNCSSSCAYGLSSTIAGDVYTIAGNGTITYSGNYGNGGLATSAALGSVRSLAVDSAGDVFIGGGVGYGSMVLMVAANNCASSCPWGLASTTANHIYDVAGYQGSTYSEGACGSGQGSNWVGGYGFKASYGLAIDTSNAAANNLYVSNSGCNQIVQLTSSGTLSVVAGSSSGALGNSGNGSAATAALFNQPTQLAAYTAAGTTTIYVVDGSTNAVRAFTVGGNVNDFAGSSSGAHGYTGDGGPATSALLYNPAGIAVDSSGNVYIGDGGNIVVVQASSGNLYNLAGSPSGVSGTSGYGGQAGAAFLTSLSGLSINSSNNLYASENGSRILKINTALPALTSNTPNGYSAKSGDVLTLTNVPWAGYPAPTFSYQWEDCNSSGLSCSNISGATSSTYTLQNSDVGHTVVGVVTGTNVAGNESVSSVPTALITSLPVNTAVPTISGTTTDGSVLTAATGTWSGSPIPTFAYQWQRCSNTSTTCSGGTWSNIAGATSSAYSLQDADTSFPVRVVVAATNTAGNASETSAASAPVASITPVNTFAPAVSGTVINGQTLTTTNGSWTGSSSFTYAYQWQRCNSSGSSCVSIGGATSSFYTITEADATHTLRSQVTATGTTSGAGNTSAASTATVEVQAVSPGNTVAPEVSGEDKDGSTLSVTNGTWSGSPAPTYTRHWQRDSGGGESYVNISGAEASSYTLVNADVGYKLRVVVTANNEAYSGGGVSSANSNETVKVQAVTPANTLAPAVSGEVKDGATLTSTTGSWSGAPAPIYSYQWQRETSGSWTNISGATNSVYVVTDSDVGHKLRVIVTATNTTYYGGGSASKESLATGESQAAAPANTVAPVASGTTKDGSVLSVTAGTWSGLPVPTYTYQWQRSSGSGESYVNISGAESSTYTLADADVGYKTRAVVTASNSAYPGGSSSSKESNESAKVEATTPMNTVAPAVSGTTKDGATLTTTSGTWSGAPAPTYSYQWQRYSGSSWESISGATSSTYTLTDVDVGHKLRSAVTASNASSYGGSSVTAYSSESGSSEAEPPVNTGAPTVTGTSKDGSVLSVTNGTWSGLPAPTYTYRWQRNNGSGESYVNIGGAESSTYTLGDADVGYKVRAVVTASNEAYPGGSSASASSNETSKVEAVTPVNTIVPTASGGNEDGSVLTATNGTWSGAPTPTYSYQWQREVSSSWTNIGGATSSAYTLTDSDVGHKIRIAVTATNASDFGGSAVTADSAASETVDAVTPANTVAPAVSGESKDGSTLTTTTGTWSGLPAPTYSYQWQRNSGSGESYVNISGATSNSYSLTDSDVGYQVQVVLTATNASYIGGAAVSADSNETAKVEAVAPANTVAPAVTGEDKDGMTLTTTDGTWSGAPAPTYGYQWQRYNGSSWESITGATSSTYTLTDVDVGHALRAAVTASNASSYGGSAVTADSDESGSGEAVQPANSTAPAVTGEAKDGSVLTTTDGTWTGSPAPTFTYQWQKGSGSGGSYVSISGATSATYTLTDSDVGYELRAVVTASNEAYPGGSAVSEGSNVTAEVEAVPPVNTAVPTVSGEAKVGHTLTSSAGVFTGAPAPARSYQWQSCNASGASCANIGGATANTYTVVSVDIEHTLRSVVTASNASSFGGGEISANSTHTSAVLSPTPVNTEPPVIYGEARASHSLGTTNGRWTNSPESYGYQWERCDNVGGACASIPGAISSSDTLTSEDVGHTLRVTVTAINSEGSASETSAPSSVVVPSETPPGSPSAPTESTNTPSYGSPIESSAGTGSEGGSPAPTYSYQWQRCATSSSSSCENISGATSRSYTPQEADVGNYLRVAVTATNSSGNETTYSAETSEGVSGLPPGKPSAPTLSTLSPIVGSSVESSVGTGSTGGSPIPTYIYQWQLCATAEASSCANIDGATSRTYMPTSEDLGKYLRVYVEAENSTGTWVDPSEPAYSPEGGPVEGESEAPVSCTNVPVAPGGSTPSGPAVSCTEVGETVKGYGLTLTAPLTDAAAPIILSSKDQISSYSIAERTGDNTGTGNGWSESFSQTTFTSGAHVIGANSGSGESFEATSGAGKVGKEAGNTAAALTRVTVADAAENTDTNPTEEEFPVLLPLNVPVPVTSATATVGDSPSVVFQTSSKETGLGNFIITPTVLFDVPADTYAGSYTATAEVDLTTGP